MVDVSQSLGSDVTVQEVQEHYIDCSTDKKKK